MYLNVYRSALIWRKLPCPEKFLDTRLIILFLKLFLPSKSKFRLIKIQKYHFSNSCLLLFCTHDFSMSELITIKSVLKAEHHGEVGNVSYMLLLDSNGRICFGWSVSLFILETFSLYFRVINSSSSFRSKFGMSVSVLIKWGGLSFPFVPDIFPVTVIYNFP